MAAPWGRARSAALRRASHRAGDQGAASGLSAGRASRSSIGRAKRRLEVVSEGEIPCECARGGGSRWMASARLSTRRSRSGWSGRGMAELVLRMAPADVVGLRPMTGQASVVGERLLIFRAGRVGLARVGLARIGAGAARDRSDRQRQGHERSAYRHRPHPRSVAPVFFETSATILAIAASISASVSVRSRGCKVTLIAIDFAPSGRPLPW